MRVARAGQFLVQLLRPAGTLGLLALDLVQLLPQLSKLRVEGHDPLATGAQLIVRFPQLFQRLVALLPLARLEPGKPVQRIGVQCLGALEPLPQRRQRRPRIVPLHRIEQGLRQRPLRRGFHRGHMVAVPFRDELPQLPALRGGQHRQVHPQPRQRRRQRAFGVLQQRLVRQHRTRPPFGRRLGVEQVFDPQQPRQPDRPVVAGHQRIGHLARVAQHEQRRRLHAHPLQHRPPQRQQPAHARVLHRPQHAAGKLLAQQRLQRGGGGRGRLGLQPVRRQRTRVVPGTSQRGQQPVVDGHHAGMLPEPLGVVRPRLHQLAAQFHAAQAQGAGHRGGAAAVHAQHQDGALRAGRLPVLLRSAQRQRLPPARRRKISANVNSPLLTAHAGRQPPPRPPASAKVPGYPRSARSYKARSRALQRRIRRSWAGSSA